MDNYFEQNVAGERGPREQILYGGCWTLVVVLALFAMFNAAGILRIGESGVGVNWLNLALTVIGAALAFLCYRIKDSVFREFDYILWNSELEVCAVYNRVRRKKLGTIPLSKVLAWGPVDAMAGQMHGLKPLKWCVRSSAAWCVIYPKESGKAAVLLELSDEMRAQILSSNRALRNCEVKP